MRRKLFFSELRADAFVRRIRRFTRFHVMHVQYCGRGVFSVDFC